MEQGISLIFRGFEYDRLDYKEKYEISELIIAAGFKFEVLELNKIKYSDWGETAVSGWKQIFFHDPDGNIIEVHQKK